MADLYGNIRAAESGGDRFAKNPRSSAYGPDQFIAATWLATVKKHRPDVASGKTDSQILQLRSDERLSGEMTQAYARDNQSYLRSRGVDPEANTYLAHFAGPQGAAALHARPDDPVERILTPAAIKANPHLRGKTGADVIAWASMKQSGSGGPSQAMAKNLVKRFGAKTEGGATAAAAPNADVVGMARGPASADAGMQQLKSAMAGKTYSPDSIAAYGNLAKTGQDVASKATGWQQALLGIGTAGIGSYLQGGETKKKEEYEAAIAGAMAGATNPIEVAQAMIQSKDEKIRNAGIELMAKNVGQAPQSRTIEGPYGTKIQQDYVGGQWVTAGGGAQPQPGPQQAASQPAAAPPEAAQPMIAPAPAPQPQGAPAPAGAMLGGPQMPTQNIGQVGASGMPPAPEPAAPAPQAPSAPQFRIGPAVPKAPDGSVHKLAPDGSGYLYGPPTAAFPQGAPVFENKVEADERAKLVASNETDVAGRTKAASGFSGLLGELKMAPEEYGKQAFERALGPRSASSNADQNTTGGAISAALGFVPQQMARFNAEAETYLQGGAKPTDVRDSVEMKLLNLATLAKPFVRKPGEGAWTDADQANLERIVGKASRSRDTAEYNRRLDEAERVLSKAFDVKIPRVEAAPKTANAPISAEDDVTGWESYRKQYLGF